MNAKLVGVLAALGVLVVGGLGVAYTRRMPYSPFAPDPLKDGAVVLLLGDSLGVGTSQHLANALAAANVSLDAEAHVGWTARQVRKLFESDAAMRGDAVVISLGSNDAALLDPAGEADDVAAIVQLARDRGAERIVWIVPPNYSITPPSPATPEKQQIFRALFESQGIEILEPNAEVLATIGPDRIHLPPKGYEALGQQVSALLLS